MLEDDVPISVDYRVAEKARKWSASALDGRPWRAEMFALFAHTLGNECAGRTCRVLELGSGPGFLAREVLKANACDYVALDFSAAMHDLARQNLGELAGRVRFVERNLLAQISVRSASKDTQAIDTLYDSDRSGRFDHYLLPSDFLAPCSMDSWRLGRSN